MNNIRYFLTFILISISFSSLCQTPLIYNYRELPVYHRNEAVLENALREKQQLQDLRKQDVYNQGKSVLNLMNKIETRNSGLTETQSSFRKFFIEQVNVTLTWDLTYDTNYFNAKNWISSMEDKVYAWL